MTIDVVYKCDVEYEIRKLINTLYSLKCGFYQNTNFKLANKVYKNDSTRVRGYKVLIPPKVYNFVKNSYDWNINGDEQILQKADIKKFLYLAKYLDFKHIECPWNLKLHKKAFESYANFFCANVKRVEICLTTLGTMGSFTTLQKDPYVFRLYTRSDLDTPIRSYLGMLIREVYPNRPWVEYQSLQNFLAASTNISKVLNLKPIRDLSIAIFNERMLIDNDRIYKELGFSLKRTISIRRNNIELEGYGIVDILTKNEDKILKLILENGKNITTIENIGESLWQNPDNFSLQAITKLIERIRSKLKILGLNKNIIHTVHGKGYNYYE